MRGEYCPKIGQLQSLFGAPQACPQVAHGEELSSEHFAMSPRNAPALACCLVFMSWLSRRKR